jgi:hypothetical protein
MVVQPKNTMDIYICFNLRMIHVDIGGHPPFPTSSKQFSGNFGNLLFLAVFNFQGHFEALNDVFLGKQVCNMEFTSILHLK